MLIDNTYQTGPEAVKVTFKMRNMIYFFRFVSKQTSILSKGPDSKRSLMMYSGNESNMHTTDTFVFHMACMMIASF